MSEENIDRNCPDRTLQALANQRSERMLLDVATWLEMKVEATWSPSLCRLIAMHYDLLAEHREVVSRGEVVAMYRRRGAHWRLRGAVYSRACDDSAAMQLPQRPNRVASKKHKTRNTQEDLI